MTTTTTDNNPSQARSVVPAKPGSAGTNPTTDPALSNAMATLGQSVAKSEFVELAVFPGGTGSVYKLPATGATGTGVTVVLPATVAASHIVDSGNPGSGGKATPVPQDPAVVAAQAQALGATVAASSSESDGLVDQGQIYPHQLRSILEGAGFSTTGLTDAHLEVLVGAYANSGTRVSAEGVSAMVTDGALRLENGTATLNATAGTALSGYIAGLVGVRGAPETRTVDAAALRTGLERTGLSTAGLSDAQLQALVQTHGSVNGQLDVATVAALFQSGELQINTGVVTHHPQTLTRDTLRAGLEAEGHTTAGLTDAALDRLIAAYGQQGDGTLGKTELAAAIEDGALVLVAGGGAASIDTAAAARAPVDYTAERIVGSGGVADGAQLRAGLLAAGYTANITDADLDALIDAYGGGTRADALDSNALRHAINDGALVLSPAGEAAVHLPAAATRRSLRSEEVADPNSDVTSNLVVRGGVWAHGESTTNVAIARPDLIGLSTAYAQELIGGKTVQEVIGLTPTADQAAAMNDAFEVLGISNRQIAHYTEEAAREGVDSINFGGNSGTAGAAWLDTLKDAGRIRMAVDERGADTLSSYFFNSSGNVDDSANLPPELSAAGMVRAVEKGTADSGQFPWYKLRSSTQAARDMILGGSLLFGSQNVIFPGVSLTSAATRASQGRELLGTTELDFTLGVDPALANGLKPGLPEAVDSLQNPPEAWDEAGVTEAVAAANIVMQVVGPEVQKNIDTALAVPGTAYETPEEQQAVYRAALDKALTAAGIDLRGSDVADTLLDAALSPAFASVIAGSTERENLTYSVLGFFSPPALTTLGVLQKYSATPGTPLDQVQRDTTRRLLQSMAAQGPGQGPAQAPVPTGPDLKDSAGVIAQWIVASARWGVAALGKAAKGAYEGTTPTSAQFAQFETFTAGVLERAALDPAGRFLDESGAVIGTGTDVQAALEWAANKAGITGASQWINGAAEKFGKYLDASLIGPTLAMGSLVVRSIRLANPQNLPIDQTTRGQLIASTIGDLFIVTEALVQPQRLGPAVSNAIARTENWIRDPLGFGNLVQWDIEMGPMADALALPVQLDPNTGVGRFVNQWLPQAGGVGNLIYGGFNIAQGVRQIAAGQPVQGALTATVGAIDFFNGFAQLKGAISPANVDNVWASMRDFGYAYPSWAQVMSRAVATGVGAAQAGLAIRAAGG